MTAAVIIMNHLRFFTQRDGERAPESTSLALGVTLSRVEPVDAAKELSSSAKPRELKSQLSQLSLKMKIERVSALGKVFNETLREVVSFRLPKGCLELKAETIHQNLIF